MCAINLSIFTNLEHQIQLHAHDQLFLLSINCKKDDYDNSYLTGALWPMSSKVIQSGRLFPVSKSQAISQQIFHVEHRGHSSLSCVSLFARSCASLPNTKQPYTN